MKFKHYPKDVNLPKNVVLLRREQRKVARKKKIVKPIKKKQTTIPGTCEFKFKIPKDRKDYYEFKNETESSALCLFRINKSRTADTVKIAIKKPLHIHIDWFWNMLQNNRMLCELALSLFPNTKEQSESVAALHSFHKHCNKNEKVGVIVVADGVTPRTGFLFALEPSCQWVVSVDPLMHTKWIANNELPNNLQAFKCKVEDLNMQKFDWDCIDRVIVVAVHAHVGFEHYLATIASCKKQMLVIAIPCCVALEIPNEQLPQVSKEQDYGILSPCRTAVVWKN